MLPETDPAESFATPRPGFAHTLGVLNIVFAAIMIVALLCGIAWVTSVERMADATTAPAIPVIINVNAGSKSTQYVYNPMMGMDEPGFLRFAIVDIATALLLNGAMLASGIGLVNLRRWGARLGTWTAWIKLARLLLLWTFFVVAVSPALSESLARSVSEMVRSQQAPSARMATMADFTRIYSIANLVLAVMVIVLGSIYPVASLWLLRKPGLRAALKASGRPSLGA